MAWWKRSGPSPDDWRGQAKLLGWTATRAGRLSTRLEVRFTTFFNGHPVFMGVLLREALSGSAGDGWTAASAVEYEEADHSLVRVHGPFLRYAGSGLLPRGESWSVTVPVAHDQIAGVLFQSTTNRAWVSDGSEIVVLLDHDRGPHLFDLGFRDQSHEETPISEADPVVGDGRITLSRAPARSGGVRPRR